MAIPADGENSRVRAIRPKGRSAGRGIDGAFGDLELAEFAVLPPDPNPDLGVWIIDCSLDLQTSRPVLQVDELDHGLGAAGNPPMTTRLTVKPPAPQETIPVNRAGIRKHMAFDQHIGGVEGIDQRSSRLFLSTATQT